MPRSTHRDLPKSADLFITKEELLPGRRIVLTAAAGARLAGKQGIILAEGATPSQVKVLLDGSKRFVILHARYVNLAGSSLS
nr:hypothetical protein [Bradyrhizobium zhengyangense]